MGTHEAPAAQRGRVQVLPERLRQTRPRAVRGQGVSGIQTGDWRRDAAGPLDSSHAVPRLPRSLAARLREA